MNASEQSKNLHATVEAMLGELTRLAKNPGTSSDELYDQSADILRILFQPDAVAVFLFGVKLNPVQPFVVAVIGWRI